MSNAWTTLTALATGATCAMLATLVVSAPAAAHPHVWVTVETTVLFSQGSISGFRHKWTFEEFYTAMAVQGLDTNNDGIYSREELAELAKVNVEGLAEFQYFTQARLGETPIGIEAPKDYWLEYVDKPVDPDEAKLPNQKILPRAGAATTPDSPKSGFFSRLWGLIFGAPNPETAAQADAGGSAKVLSLNFMLPLRQPVLSDAPDFTFSVGDPSFFIAFDMAKPTPIKFGDGAPQTCRVDLGAEADDTPKPPQGFASQTELPAFSIPASRAIKITCGPRS